MALDSLYPRSRDHGPPDGFSDLREALETLVPSKSGGGLVARRVGNALRRLKGRIVRGRKLITEDARGGVVRWRVVGTSVAPPEPTTPDELKRELSDREPDHERE